MISNYVHVSKKLEAHKKHRLILQSTVIYQYTANIRPDVKKKNIFWTYTTVPCHLKCSHSKHTVHSVISVNPSLLKFGVIWSRLHGLVERNLWRVGDSRRVNSPLKNQKKKTLPNCEAEKAFSFIQKQFLSIYIPFFHTVKTSHPLFF